MVLQSLSELGEWKNRVVDETKGGTCNVWRGGEVGEDLIDEMFTGGCCFVCKVGGACVFAFPNGLAVEC